MPKDKIRAPVKTCVIDNPATMARECWQDGRLLYAYSFTLFFQKSARDPSRSAWDDIGERRFFGANIGPWRKGQIVGDIAARATDGATPTPQTGSQTT